MRTMLCPNCWGSKTEPHSPDAHCHYCAGCGSVPDQDVSQHLWLGSLLHSDTAIRRHISNAPTQVAQMNLGRLAREILDPIFEQYGPFHINSAYRCAQLNAAVGGSTTSAHMYGFAADIVPLKGTRKDFVEWLLHKSNLPFDQAIFEGSWDHIGLVNPADGSQRKQALMAFPNELGHMAYTEYNPHDARIV